MHVHMYSVVGILKKNEEKYGKKDQQRKKHTLLVYVHLYWKEH